VSAASEGPDAIVLTVDQEAHGERLDRVLEAALCRWTRSQLKAFVEAGHVRVDGAVAAKAGLKLRRGQVVTLVAPEPAPSRAEAEDLPLTIRHEDEHLLVVAKAAGMVVHPARGNLRGTLVNAILHHCPDLRGVGDEQRPGIVHRLDKDTSGLLVIAKDDVTHRGLQRQLSARTMTRRYVALCLGAGLAVDGSFRTAYGRHPTDRLRFTSRGEHPRAAITHWEVLARGALSCLVGVRLETGRTHQIRVHFADHGHPLAGDPLYGRPLAGYQPSRAPAEARALTALPTQALHAAVLGFEHPVTGERILLVEPPPRPLVEAAEALPDGRAALDRWLEAVREDKSAA
jgi:23S rRNA pseudouridine1911/1915/1917 synthase